MKKLQTVILIFILQFSIISCAKKLEIPALEKKVEVITTYKLNMCFSPQEPNYLPFVKSENIHIANIINQKVLATNVNLLNEYLNAYIKAFKCYDIQAQSFLNKKDENENQQGISEN